MKSILQQACFVVLLSATYLPVQAAYYRWTDENGKVHYSSSVPAGKSKLGHTELDKRGLRKKTVASEQRNRELKAIEDSQREERERLAKIKAEKEAKAAIENRLLSIFNSEDEIIKAYNSKLNLAQVTIDLLKSRHKKQSEKLEKLEKRYTKLTKVKHKQKLEEEINMVNKNLIVYQEAITDNLREKDKVKSEFENTLARFKKIHSNDAE